MRTGRVWPVLQDFVVVHLRFPVRVLFWWVKEGLLLVLGNPELRRGRLRRVMKSVKSFLG